MAFCWRVCLHISLETIGNYKPEFKFVTVGISHSYIQKSGIMYHAVVMLLVLLRAPHPHRQPKTMSVRGGLITNVLSDSSPERL